MIKNEIKIALSEFTIKFILVGINECTYKLALYKHKFCLKKTTKIIYSTTVTFQVLMKGFTCLHLCKQSKEKTN